MTGAPERNHGSDAAARAAARTAVEAGRRALLELQDERGFWPIDQPTEIGSTAEELLFREFTGQNDAELTAATARWIRSQQYPDGGWPACDVSPADLSVSVLAYCALRLAGDSPDAYHMAQAAGWIRDAGGLAASGVRTRVWLAMFGQVRWDELRVPPPEAVYLPASYAAWLPGRPSWGRPTVVPLSVIAAFRPARRLPFSLAELRLGGTDRSPRLPEPRAPVTVGRAAALRRCAMWITSAQLSDGSWLADGPGWLLALIALHLLGYSREHPALVKGMAAVGARAVWTQTSAGPARHVELGDRDVQATAEAILALADAGLPAEHEALLKAGGWLLARELRARAGWLAGQREALGRPEPASQATARGSAGAGDSASVLLSLRRVRLPAEAGQRETAMCSVRWLTGQQGKDGGWAAGPLGLTRLPGRDRRGGRPAGAGLTGQVLAALAAAGQPGSLAIRRAVACLLRLQRPDGSWPDEGGTSDLQATCVALAALVAAGVLPGKPTVRRAVRWLIRQQNPDGSWGQDPAAAVTARVVLALLAAGTRAESAADAAVDRGAAWLTRAQLGDGTWRRQPRAPGSERRVDIAPLRALGRYLSGAVAVPGPRQVPGTQPAAARLVPRQSAAGQTALAQPGLGGSPDERESSNQDRS
jgi:squalene-hopene/tetraprenyl-beta-curcumene cyclase